MPLLRARVRSRSSSNEEIWWFTISCGRPGGDVFCGFDARSTLYRGEYFPYPRVWHPKWGGLAFNERAELVVVLRRHGILIAETHRNPDEFVWRVFSDASMHNPCGVMLGTSNDMLVPQMEELTWIRDLNGDGLADLYQAVSTSWGISGNYHETIAGPVADGEGGWFLAIGTASHNGPVFYNVRGEYSPIGRRGRNFSAVPYKGWVVKVAPDGSMVPWASGFRANNGMCMDSGWQFMGDG